MLELKNIWKTYDTTPCPGGVDLKVRQGETCSDYGAVGLRKSTLIRCINRLTEPDMGDILVNGDSVLGLSQAELMAFRRKVGFVFQQFHLIGRLTVLENVMFHLVLAGFDRGWAEAQAAAALAESGTQSTSGSLMNSAAGSSSG